MKRFLKPLWIGLLIGAVELGAVGLMAGVGKGAAFEDLAFGFGIATLLLALLVLFSGRRVQAGMNISPNNAAAQTAFQAQVAYDEAKTVESTVELAVQVNGKLKCTIKLAVDADKQTAIDTAMAEEKVQHAIEGKQIVKQIVVPGKIVNLVVK